MAKFHWQGATGDDAPDDQKVNFLPELPAPSREVYSLMHRATALGFWLKWCRDPAALRRFGARYRLTRAGSHLIVYKSDNLEDIESCIREFETTKG